MRKLAVLAVLLIPAGSALAHPGHGALDLHWHADDLVWMLLGAVAVFGAGFLLGKRTRR
jgi:hypothetical protein